MENPLKAFIEKIRHPVDSRELNSVEFSQLLADLDKVWMSDELVEGGHELIEYLGELSEREAASALASYLTPYSHLDLKEKLGMVGIAVGELTPGRSTPSGVRGMIRSKTPILLITNDSPKNFHRPIEIARAIGEMIYGEGEPVHKFVKALNSGFILNEDTQLGAIE